MPNTLPDLTLFQLQRMMLQNGVEQLLVKELAANDNAKNQLYLAGNIEVANILPIGELRVEVTEKGNNSLKAPMPLSWLQPDGKVIEAPGAQIILYPQYPEVRLSGFLRGSINAPNELLNKRGEGRLFFFGITSDRRIVCWAVGPESIIARHFHSLVNLERIGVFAVVPLRASESGSNTRIQLLKELRRIHLLDWIESKALSANGSIEPCLSSHCIGYTLEAEFGIPRNGKAEPDFKGWEIKAETVKKFGTAATSKAITLMTPEPTGGYYRTDGVEAFLRKYGYLDKRGRIDRINFGGVFRAGNRHPGTKLTLTLDGYDVAKGRIENPAGSLALLTDHGHVAAEWSFATLMTLWTRKHAQAVYVPAQSRTEPSRQYRYGSTVRLAVGTDFAKLLHAISAGFVYYDPGIKLEGASTKLPRTKRRSQFRVASRNLSGLYAKVELIDVMKKSAEITS